MESKAAVWTQDARDDARLDGMRVHFLLSQSPITFFYPLPAALALGAVLWDRAPHATLLCWQLLVVAYSVLRWLLLWNHLRRRSAPDDPQAILGVFALGALVSGLLWGAAPILIVPYPSQNAAEFTLANGLIVLVVCGLAAGAVVAYAVSLRVLFLYIIPALLPPAFYLISLGDRYNSTLGGFILLYFVFLSIAALRVSRQLNGYLETELRLQRLRRDLDRGKWLQG